jgi:hypothetical protein
MLLAFLKRITSITTGGSDRPVGDPAGYDLEEGRRSRCTGDVPNVRKRIQAKQVFEKARRQHKHYARLHGLKPL